MKQKKTTWMSSLPVSPSRKIESNAGTQSFKSIANLFIAIIRLPNWEGTLSIGTRTQAVRPQDSVSMVGSLWGWTSRTFPVAAPWVNVETLTLVITDSGSETCGNR